jgi:hypothetical protein
MICHRIEHGVERSLEEQKEAIRLVDLDAMVILEEISSEAVMTAEQTGGVGIADAPDDCRAADQIADQERPENVLTF